MSQIDTRLDLDNALKEFVQNTDEDDFVLYFRHNFKDGEGVCFTNMTDGRYIPLISDDEYKPSFGDESVFDSVKSVILTLAADLIKDDKNIRKQFMDFIKSK